MIAGYAVTPVVLPLMGLAAAITMIGLAVALAGNRCVSAPRRWVGYVGRCRNRRTTLKATLDALAESIPKFGTTLAEDCQLR